MLSCTETAHTPEVPGGTGKTFSTGGPGHTAVEQQYHSHQI